MLPWHVYGYDRHAEFRRSESRQQMTDVQWSPRDKLCLEQHHAEEAETGRHQLTLADCKLQPSVVKHF